MQIIKTQGEGFPNLNNWEEIKINRSRKLNLLNMIFNGKFFELLSVGKKACEKHDKFKRVHLHFH